MNQGDEVTTPRGQIERVLEILNDRVITYESMLRGTSYRLAELKPVKCG